MSRRPGTETAAAPLLRRFTDLRRYSLEASDGDVGHIDDVYLDDLSWTVRYLVADTGTCGCPAARFSSPPPPSAAWTRPVSGCEPD
jgi:hypothetical protein